MEKPLRCNITQCRVELRDRAVVTTCSHIFCVDCASKTGLSRAIEARRSCPACNAPLINPDDAVTTALQPTEDYKTSVLSGLDPTTVMECAGRALAFWAYQSTQEIAYHEHVAKNLTDKYGHLSSQLDRVVNNANNQIQELQTKLNGFSIDQKTTQQKNQELIELYRDKSRKHAQTQHLYDTLKKRILMSQVETAASDNVNQTLKSLANTISRPETYNGSVNHQTHGPGVERIHSGNADHIPVDEHGDEQLHRHQRQGSGSHVSENIHAMALPSQVPRHRMHDITAAVPTPMHRTQLPGAAQGVAQRSQIPMSNSRPSTLNHYPSGTALRNSTGGTHVNRGSTGSSSRYGITAGMKVGRAPATGVGDLGARFGYDSQGGSYGVSGNHFY